MHSDKGYLAIGCTRSRVTLQAGLKKISKKKNLTMKIFLNKQEKIDT